MLKTHKENQNFDQDSLDTKHARCTIKNGRKVYPSLVNILFKYVFKAIQQYFNNSNSTTR